ncbi:hypothetical protein SASPL_106812 [Salvia splendens]|uniref:Uncharacterized protein n=1 Tax=Salvia splendens TaxID=180675 RepID=A0A8X8Y9A8_SALSN|nr:hypothetical protein SASPL_106812 [Salvia splendens]
MCWRRLHATERRQNVALPPPRPDPDPPFDDWQRGRGDSGRTRPIMSAATTVVSQPHLGFDGAATRSAYHQPHTEEISVGCARPDSEGFRACQTQRGFAGPSRGKLLPPNSEVMQWDRYGAVSEGFRGRRPTAWDNPAHRFDDQTGRRGSQWEIAWERQEGGRYSERLSAISPPPPRPDPEPPYHDWQRGRVDDVYQRPLLTAATSVAAQPQLGFCGQPYRGPHRPTRSEKNPWERQGYSSTVSQHRVATAWDIPAFRQEVHGGENLPSWDGHWGRHDGTGYSEPPCYDQPRYDHYRVEKPRYEEMRAPRFDGSEATNLRAIRVHVDENQKIGAVGIEDQFQQKQSDGFDLASPDSASSEGGIRNPLSSQRQPVFQDQIIQIQSGNNMVAANQAELKSGDQNANKTQMQQQVQESGYVISNQYDRNQPQVHRPHQFVHSGDQYIPVGVMSYGKCAEGCLTKILVKNKIVVCDELADSTEAILAGAAGIIKKTPTLHLPSLCRPVPGIEANASSVRLDSQLHQLLKVRNQLPAFSQICPNFLILVFWNISIETLVGMQGTIPKAYISSTKTRHDHFAPRVTGFSAKGPNLIIPNILKPDVTAPGTTILAAFSPAATPSLLVDKRAVNFSILSGTSMACPHVSGAAAYVKSFRPDWSPATIKSALMTTAWILKKQKIKDAEFAYRAGHIDPVRATSPGLIYDTSIDDYINLLCSLGYNTTIVQQITRDNKSNCPKTGNVGSKHHDLNYPTMAVKVERNASFLVKFTRKVTNVGRAKAVYRAKIVRGSGISVVVKPMILRFKALNERKSFVVSVEGNIGGKKKIGASLEWSDGIHRVRSPIVVYDDSAFQKHRSFYFLVFNHILNLVTSCASIYG